MLRSIGPESHDRGARQDDRFLNLLSDIELTPHSRPVLQLQPLRPHAPKRVQ